MNYGNNDSVCYLYIILAGFILIGLILGSRPKVNTGSINPAFYIKDNTSDSIRKDGDVTFMPLPITNLNLDRYHLEYDEYISDPENEIDYEPEIFDFLAD